MTKNEIIDNITEWFRSKYDLKVDYSTMTISIKKKRKTEVAGSNPACPTTSR